MKPRLAALRAAITKNKVPLGVVGAGAVAALAWRSRSTSTSTSERSTSSTTGVTTSPAYYSAGGQMGGAYDSTSSDVYNAIQPQLEQLADLQRRLLDRTETAAPSPVPVPGPAPEYTDPRREAIANMYRTILRREPDAAGLNAWDATGVDLDAIRSGIVRSNEALTAK